jgi:predicted metal-dependent phosphoesterase TrpH
MAYKADFHTHSNASPDGALTLEHYRQMLERGLLDSIAVTDHNTITNALAIQKALGDAIIVGEEITTVEGEIIGLYLSKAVPPQLSAAETITRIRQQGGIVYIPHPFETVRKGITPESLGRIAQEVDIIEAYNGRAVFQNYSNRALEWAKKYKVAVAAGSDAHGNVGWGRTYTMLTEQPTRQTLIRLLRDANYERSFPGIRGILYPKFNRLRHGRRHA